MTAWRRCLRADPIEWLLEKDDKNPSIRYFTLRDLLDRPDHESEVQNAKAAIMATGVVPRILAKLDPGGFWGRPEEFYIRSKYKGTVWSFIQCIELGADEMDERIGKVCEFILENAQDPESGGFAYCSIKSRGGGSGGGDPDKLLPCLTGNMVWCLITSGYLDDPRVQKGIEWITTYQRFDDGIENRPVGWPYDRYEKCWGKHTCTMSIVKALKALAAIPEDKRSKEVKQTIKSAVEFLLEHHIYKRSHDPGKIANVSWTEFGFPLMWQTDALEVLDLLTMLGYEDERMKEAIELVVSKQDEHGRWLLERSFNGRMLTSIERKGKPSKWITFHALRALKNFTGNHRPLTTLNIE